MKDLLDTAVVYAARAMEVSRLLAEEAAAWMARQYISFLVFRMFSGDDDKRGPSDE